jgi:ribosomal protein L7/L12
MKKITCIQQYVIDNLIEDKILTSNSLLDAVSKVCSKEQFDNMLSILIETPIPCTNISKLEHKENLARISIFIPEKTSTDAKIKIIKILQKQFNFSLNQTKEYVDSCIGKFNILPKTIMQTEIDEITKKLEPYNVTISILGFFIKKVNVVNITASTL